jgi:hypothetical protein
MNERNLRVLEFPKIRERMAGFAVSEMGRAAKNTALVFAYLEANPIIDIGKTAQALGLSFNTVSSAVKRLEDIPNPVIKTNLSIAFSPYRDEIELQIAVLIISAKIVHP